jgi:hypothetical protein
MGVIVASSVSKSGSQISGNTVHMVVVQTDPATATTRAMPERELS